MKIECDKCHAKYSIADEKVRGKTFKIRCKKCKNMIIVRGRTASEAAPAAPSEPAASAEPGWHLAIDGETVGPISADEVRARYQAGEIDKETAVWTEGFENWVVLGEVEAFADLPDRSAGGTTDSDPFAPSAEAASFAPGEGAAAKRAVGGGVNFDQAAEEPAPQPQSPRVTKLTGQRNENSVLFSLDSLQAMATGGGSGGGGSAGRGGGATLATSAPSSEGSGLIDIRALGAMVGGGDAGAAPGGGAGGGDDVALPSFAGGGALGAISATPLVATPAAAPAAEEKSKVMMYGLAAVVVVLLAAVGGLAYYVLTLEPQPAERVVIKEVPSVREAENKGAAEGAEDEEAKAKADAKEEEGKAPADDDASGGAQGGNAAVRRTGSGRKGSRKKGRKASSAGAAAAPAPAPASGASKPSGGGGADDLDVDCILDPSKCKTGASKKKVAKKASSGGSTDPNAPTQLSTSDVRAGVNAVKSAAKACGRKHGAAPGTKVTVKLSISGATGRVQSATAQPPHGGTPLGNCVASALKKAKFRAFKKPVMGVLVPIRM